MPRNAAVQPHQPALQALVAAIEAIARGESPESDPADLLDAALNAAQEGSEGADPYALPIQPDAVVSRRLAELRRDAGLTQIGLADVMTALGFDWKRSTVTDTEREARRLSLREMYGVAVAFGVPLVELLLAKPGEPVTTEEGDESAGLAFSSRHARELIVGRGGRVGRGGPMWAPAANACPPDVDRPATELWKRRRAAESET